MPTKFSIRRFGVISFANIIGLLYGLLGLIVGAFISLFSLFGAALSSATGNGNPFRQLFGVAAIFVLPIIYGVLGWIGGVITMGLYNLVAGIIGGVEVECVQQTPSVPTGSTI